MNKIKMDSIYYALLVLYIINQVLSESQFVNMSVVSSVLGLVRYSVLLLLIALIFYRNISVNKNIALIFGAMIFMILLNLVLVDGGMSYLPIILFVIASKNYSLEKIFRYTIISLVLSHIIVLISTLAGILQNTIDFRYIGTFTGSILSGAYYRYNMGFLVHNQLALAFFIVYLYAIVYRRDSMRLIEHIGYMILNYVIFKYFGSRIVFVLTIIIFIISYIMKFLKKFNGNQLHIIWILVYPFFSILSLIMAMAYDSSSRIWRIMDMVFNSRLSMAKQAIEYYGIHLIGNGKNSGSYNAVQGFNNTVDNGYISVLITEGIVVFGIIIGVWVYITYIAVKNNNQYLLLVLILLAIENLINNHLGSFKLIPFFCIVMNSGDYFLKSQYNGKIFHKKFLKFNIVLR